jgi:hypothetical protein
MTNVRFAMLHELPIVVVLLHFDRRPIPFATLIAEAEAERRCGGRLPVELFRACFRQKNKGGFLGCWCWLRRLTG